MWKENVEIVRRLVDGYNRRDWDAALKDAAPDFELDMSRAVGARGRDGIEVTVWVLIAGIKLTPEEQDRLDDD
jgi:hypothetical protein